MLESTEGHSLGAEGMKMSQEPSMSLGMSVEPREEQNQTMAFDRPGLESLCASRNVETGVNFQEFYQNTIFPLITETPWNGRGRYDGVTSIIGIGPTGSRKSTTMGGLFDVINNDVNLRNWAERKRLDLHVFSNPTSMVSRLAKLRGVLPSDLPSGAYGEAYRKVSELKWDLAQKHAINEQGNRRNATVLLDESGSLSSFPKIDNNFYFRQDTFKKRPVEVEKEKGFLDRANSPSYSLALDARTRKKAVILAMLRDDTQAQFTDEFRNSLFDNYLDNLTSSGVWIQFSIDNGRKIVRANANHLLTQEKAVQNAFVSFMTGTMNSPKGMIESDKNFEAVMEYLGVTPHMNESRIEAQKAVYKKLQERLDFMAEKTQHFAIINSTFLPEKTLSLDYFTHSLAAVEEPELVRPLHEIVIPALTEVGNMIEVTP